MLLIYTLHFEAALVLEDGGKRCWEIGVGRVVGGVIGLNTGV